MSSSLAPWRDFYTQTVTVANASTRDRYGNITFGAATTYKARVVGKRRVVLGNDGQQIVSMQTCYLFSSVNVLPDAKVTLSTGDVGSTETWALSPKILATGRFPDEGGQHHSVLYL